MRRDLIPLFTWSDVVLRILCPTCRLVFLHLAPATEDGVVCPRCGAKFTPDEEELLDPEDD